MELLNHLTDIALSPFSEPRRIRMMDHRIDSGQKRGLLKPERAELLKQQSRLSDIRRDLFDVTAATAVIELVSPFIQAAVVDRLTDGNLTAIAVSALPIPFLPSTTGAMRLLYGLGRIAALDLPQAIGKKDYTNVKSRLIPLALAPWNIIGLFSYPAQMRFQHREMADFMLADASSSIAGMLRVLGTPGENLANRVSKFSYWMVEKSAGKQASQAPESLQLEVNSITN